MGDDMNEPAAYQLFPDLDLATEEALRASILRWGVLVPVVKDQHGAILDGHHRATIADDLGVDYQTTRLVLGDDADRREIARTLNADRRQLDPTVRRQVEADLRARGHSFRAIAGAVGVDEKQVRKDLANADRSAVPERIVGLDGKSRPSTVQSKSRREDARAQRALDTLGDEGLPAKVVDIKRAERLAREHTAEQSRQQPVEAVVAGDIEIRPGDFREALRDLCGTVDAIVTDPPYEASWVPTFDDLGELAANLLTPDGVLAVMTGQLYLPQYLEHLSTWLEYRWVGAYVTDGPRSRVHTADVAAGWKPILIFHRPGAQRRFLLDDVFRSDGDDKTHHRWGQSESGIGALVDRLTMPGQLVVDPCLGAGTTAVVCRDLGRRFVGCDIDPVAVATAQERLGG